MSDGYAYLDPVFQEVWTTSVPKNDEAALDYFGTVHELFPNKVVKHVAKRADGETDYKPMPFVYRQDTNEVVDWEEEYGVPGKQEVH